MPRSFNLSGVKWSDPRVGMRALLGVLLVANLAAAVIAFKPFGGGADDLRRDRQQLQQQLAQLNAQVRQARNLAAKVQIARTEGDKFLDGYVTDRRVVTSTLDGELFRMAKEAGVGLLPTTLNMEPIEGSDTLSMVTINTNCTGSYANLVKFVNLVDKSERFLIIESMTAIQQQSGNNLNVSLKIDTFIKEHPGDVL
jgi:type IV pilus assembly protein PilO